MDQLICQLYGKVVIKGLNIFLEFIFIVLSIGIFHYL